MRTIAQWALPCRNRQAVLLGALLSLSICAASDKSDAAPQTGACLMRAELAGIVNAGMAGHLRDAVAAAERERCEALLLVVDTPGGMLEQTRAMVRTLLSSRVPVIAYVAPRGARAGSAGVFIVMATHVAAMAPGTTIGAAHPVVGTGQDPEEAGGKHMGEKVENDAAAFARSIAEERGRNVEWAELAVRESASATAHEALELGVVDHVAADERALLAALDGTVLTIEGRELTLALSGARVLDFEPTVQQRVLSALGDPNLAYALLMLGILGVVVEVQHPGLFFPGVVGGLSLLLAAIGLNLLPVHFGGVALLVMAAALLVAEIYITSFGLLTAGALGCMLLGSALLIDTADPRFFAEPDVRLSWGSVVPLALLLCAGSLALAVTAARLRGRRSPAGAEGLVGEIGEALTPLDGRGGTVRVHGERWQASSRQPIEQGSRVRVVAVDGLRLRVEARDEPSALHQ